MYVKLFNLTLFLIAILFNVAFSEKLTFEGNKVFKYTPKNQDEVAAILEYENDARYTFWKDVRGIGNEVHLMVGRENLYEFEQDMNKHGMAWQLMIDDVQKLIDDQKVTKLARSAEFTWDSYHELDDINAWLYSLAETYPDIAEIVIGGRSYENREIIGIKLKFTDTEYVAVVEGGIHAREWISPATVTWMINEFLTSNDPAVRHAAELFEWHLFPVINPDGYVFTFTNNRMWRKSRSINEGTTCNGIQSYGTDLNRNFDWYWNTVGTSSNPCAETYPGTEAFSESEARTFSEYTTALGDKMEMYLSLHSYGQMLLLPFSQVEPAVYEGNYPDVFEIGARALDHLQARFQSRYLIGTSPDILYPVSGDASDWAKGTFDINIVYCYELRDISQYGFLLPPEQIVPNNLEFMDSVVNIVKYAQELGYFPSPNQPDPTGPPVVEETTSTPPEESPPSNTPPEETSSVTPGDNETTPQNSSIRVKAFTASLLILVINIFI